MSRQRTIEKIMESDYVSIGELVRITGESSAKNRGNPQTAGGGKQHSQDKRNSIDYMCLFFP